jgi:RNA polymerase sigma factor (sigma-70 family)
MVNTEKNSKILNIIKAYQDKVKGFIAKKVPFSEVDDVFQEVVCNLIRADSLNEPIEQAGAWLFKAAKNEVIDRQRKKREILLWDGEDGTPGIELAEIAEVMAGQPESAEDRYLRTLFWEELAEALDRLTPDQRDVFVKTEFEGLSYKELSEETKVGINTLLSRKHKAVKALRRNLLDLYQLIVNR